MMKKILTLTVSKQWFEKIVSGEKTEEYRIIKGYWAKRLLLVRSELEEPFSKLDKDLSEKWDSISPEMAKYCFNSPLFRLPMSFLSTATTRIVHELRRRLRVSPSVSRRKVFAQASGWIMNFSSSSSSDMDKTTELSYKHLISQLRKENADLRNEVLELRKLLTKKGGKPPN